MQSLRNLLSLLLVLECSMHILAAAITTPPSSVVEYVDSTGGSGVNPADIVFDEPSGSDNTLSNNDIDTDKSTDSPLSDSATTELPLVDDATGTTEMPCSSNNSETDPNCTINVPSSADSEIDISGQSKSEDSTNDLTEATTLSPSSE